MFKIKVGKLYVRHIEFNTYSDSSSVDFTADFDDAKKFGDDDYFYVIILKELLEIYNVIILGISEFLENKGDDKDE